MNQRLNKAFEVLERSKQDIIDQLKDFSDEEIKYKPTEKEWSLAQVLSHLIFSESASLRYCKKKLLAGDQLPKRNWFSSFRMSFYNYVMLTSIRIKAPAVVEQPNTDLSLDEAEKGWSASREELKQFLEDFPEHYLNRAVYRQPVAGRITLYEMLVFFNAHLRHHQHQINRLKRAIEKF